MPSLGLCSPAHHGVERAEGLVQQQQAGLAGERARERDALPLPAATAARASARPARAAPPAPAARAPCQQIPHGMQNRELCTSTQLTKSMHSA